MTAVTSTHQLHVWKVIQPVNDFTMGKLPSTILITLYLSTSREQKSSRKKCILFLSISWTEKRKIFLWAVAFFFSFFIRLAQITPARICKEHSAIGVSCRVEDFKSWSCLRIILSCPQLFILLSEHDKPWVNLRLIYAPCGANIMFSKQQKW